MTRIALAAALALIAGPAWADDAPKCDGPNETKVGTRCWSTAVSNTMHTPTFDNAWRNLTIEQSGMWAFRCARGVERIEITPSNEVRMFCKEEAKP